MGRYKLTVVLKQSLALSWRFLFKFNFIVERQNESLVFCTQLLTTFCCLQGILNNFCLIKCHAEKDMPAYVVSMSLLRTGSDGGLRAREIMHKL